MQMYNLVNTGHRVSDHHDEAETFQSIPTGFHIEPVRAISELTNYFAEAGFQVEVAVFFFTKLVFHAII